MRQGNGLTVQTTLKSESHLLLSSLAKTEDNNLSKQLRIICEFYIQSKSITLKSEKIEVPEN